jgi:hypothetical protein
MGIFRSISNGPPEAPDLAAEKYQQALAHLTAAEKLMEKVLRLSGQWKRSGPHDWRMGDDAIEVRNGIDGMQFRCRESLKRWEEVVAFKAAHPEPGDTPKEIPVNEKLVFKRNPDKNGQIAKRDHLAYRVWEDVDMDHPSKKLWIAEWQDNDPISNDTDEEAPWRQINYAGTMAGAKDICQEHSDKQ